MRLLCAHIVLAVVSIRPAVVCYSASSEVSISVSSHLEDEDIEQLQQSLHESLARLTRFVPLLDALPLSGGIPFFSLFSLLFNLIF